eukprot:4084494-Lingulodinium_polyedra.AAC.1
MLVLLVQGASVCRAPDGQHDVLGGILHRVVSVGRRLREELVRQCSGLRTQYPEWISVSEPIACAACSLNVSGQTFQVNGWLCVFFPEGCFFVPWGSGSGTMDSGLGIVVFFLGIQ